MDPGSQGKKQTDLYVTLRPLAQPAQETKFENCVADVNIPAGEVFTSPVLKGTTGRLNVSSVYLKGYNFNNLTVVFKDGMAVEYSCDNFGRRKKTTSISGKIFFLIMKRCLLASLLSVPIQRLM